MADKNSENYQDIMARLFVIRAIHQLGYHVAEQRIVVTPISAGRYDVFIDGFNFGIWDTEKKTFVD